MREIIELFNKIQRDVALLGQLLEMVQAAPSGHITTSATALPPPLAPSPKAAPRQPLPPPPQQSHTGPKKYKRQLVLAAPLRIGDQFDWLGDRYRVKSVGAGMLTASKLDAAGNLSAGRPFEFGVQLPEQEVDEVEDAPFQTPPPGQPWVDNKPIEERRATKVNEVEAEPEDFEDSDEVDVEPEDFEDSEDSEDSEDDDVEEDISDEETFHYDEDADAEDLDDDEDYED